MKHILVVALLVTPVGVSAQSPEERGLEIAQHVDKAGSGFATESAHLEMVLINAHGETVRRKMSALTQEGTDDGDKSVLVFHSPAEVNGTKMLTWSHRENTDDQWLYLPAMKRVKRISGRNQAGSFMGSEFAYEDLASQEVAKYTYKFVADGTDNGRPGWQVERYPINKDSGYSRQVVWYDREYASPVKIDCYDRKGELLKTSVFKDYTKYGKVWRPGSVHVVNHQTRKQSTLVWSERKLGAPLGKDVFQSESLEGWKP
jgi:hypothetical protein